MLRSGKYRGCSYEQVKEKDKQYCAWLVSARHDHSLPRDLAKFARHIEEQHGGVMNVGAHKGSFYSDVCKTRPDYAEWAADLSDPGEGMKAFSEYAKKQLDEQKCCEPQKKPRTEDTKLEDGKKSCVICYNRPPEVAFVPCGHHVACARCAALVEGQGCPVCRNEILMLLKIYG